MAQDLEGLLNRIQDEGIKKANLERDRILADAKTQAEKLLADAKSKADKLTAQAEAERTKLEHASADNLRQAARDISLGLEREIDGMLQRVVSDLVGQAMTPEILGKLLVEMTRHYAQKNGAATGVEALLCPEAAAELAIQLRGALAEQMKGGVTLKPVPGLGVGMQVRFNGESVVHDLTAASVADMLAAFLNPRLVTLLRATDSK